MVRRNRERPWWLGGGSAELLERCEGCSALHAYEVEIRCVECDAPLCPLCAVRVRQVESGRCRDCAAVGEAG